MLLWFCWVPWPCAFLFLLRNCDSISQWDVTVGQQKNGRNAIELCVPSRIFSLKKINKKRISVSLKGDNFSRTGAGSQKMVGTV